MRPGLKRALKWTAGLVGLVVGAYVLYTVIVIGAVMFGWSRMMSVGRKYMDSLTEQDFKAWETRSSSYLSNAPNSVFRGPDDSKPVPADLASLGIIKIEVRKDEVLYFWMGGMDHTCLAAYKKPDGTFRFYAAYNDKDGRQLWPREESAGGVPAKR
jgi:hypothetical protein